MSKATSSAVSKTSPDRFRILSTNAVVALCAAIIGYLLGFYSWHSDLVAVRAVAQQVQTENFLEQLRRDGLSLLGWLEAGSPAVTVSVWIRAIGVRL